MNSITIATVFLTLTFFSTICGADDTDNDYKKRKDMGIVGGLLEIEKTLADIAQAIRELNDETKRGNQRIIKFIDKVSPKDEEDSKKKLKEKLQKAIENMIA